MKNLMTKSKSILVLGVATMMLFSCEMTEPMAPAERTMEAEEMMAGSAFNLSGFGMGMENTRSYADADCSVDCIEAGSGEYFVMADSKSSSVGGGQNVNTKEVSYRAYNTETHFIVEVDYDIISGRSNAEADITITIDGDQKFIGKVAKGSTVSHSIALPSGWKACDEINFSILQEELGTPITFDENYSLFAVCEEACDNSLSYVDNGDGSYTFSFTPRSSMTDAHLVFTFAQGVTVGGDLASWDGAGVTRQKTMNLSAMATYEWTVELEANCPGTGQPRANLWTDFTVNSESKKCDLENIVISCR
ncbi:hypothetical protein [Cecembia lonarensis]|uniref:Uncharacterized protein n=1 Tax=Cecembia lonarensis (strain CCUG 58316 / KCTC 22772 / LW9) TaxID=1225176 RepID=K1LAA2_CECL9|nr:hypothetical protein [Cecembia lonarensis]EKB47303.1 hypothetical protein B879_04096 [Cecembia lonarensis LW9]